MTNIAQMVNVLQAMILTDKERMVLTPTYHVFDMYVPFQGATRLDLEIKNQQQYTHNKTSIPVLSASSAKSKDGKKWLALTNSHPHKSVTVELNTKNKFKAAAGQVLTAKKMDAHNTFDHPQNIKPSAFSAKAKNKKLKIDLPAKSVMVIELK